MRLAGHLGKSISWVENLSEKELKKWMAWYSIEPFGEYRMDLRFALMTAHLIGPYLKGTHQQRLSDYILDFQPKQQTFDEMKSVLDRLL